MDHFVETLIQNKILDEGVIEAVIKRNTAEYINDNVAQIHAQIEFKVANLRAQKKRIEEEILILRQDFENEKRRLKLELEEMRQKFEFECKEERLTIDNERKSVLKQKEELLKPLEEAVQMLDSSSNSVLSQFLQLLPLLKKSSLFSSEPLETTSNLQPFLHPDSGIVDFKIPEIITSPKNQGDSELEEPVFFERFTKLIDDAGFSYREDDLKRFHISIKCNDVNILGGFSGVGKSSLASLYARALSGNDIRSERNCFLMVNVNPSWMEGRDLLGHVNTLEGRFFPAETGLYQQLIYAQEEFKMLGEQSPVYLVCLDEMNLSQVEYYFSDFMQTLERNPGERTLKCFSKESVRSECAFRNWHSLEMPTSLRFIGTVNFDETTRKLSDRLLDRANLITLHSHSLPNILSSGSNGELPECEGPPVTMKNFRHWTREGALPDDLARIIDELRAPLSRLGASMSHRSYKAICKFVASSTDLLPPEQALDIQIAQRLLSKVRGIVTEEQNKAFGELSQIIEKNKLATFEESSNTLTFLRNNEFLIASTIEG